jgi:hypothetical protein
MTPWFTTMPPLNVLIVFIANRPGPILINGPVPVMSPFKVSVVVLELTSMNPPGGFNVALRSVPALAPV